MSEKNCCHCSDLPILPTKSPPKMAIPTVTMDELSSAIQDSNTKAPSKKVLECILNDYMDLQWGKETPYTTGKQVLPSEATLQDVENATAAETRKQFKELFVTITQVYKSGDLTPRSVNDGTWDPKLKPVLVLVSNRNSNNLL